MKKVAIGLCSAYCQLRRPWTLECATMETTRSPFQQIIDYRIFFAFLVLFTKAVFAESVTNLTTNDVFTTLATKNGSEAENTIATDALTMATVTKPESSSTPTAKHSLSGNLPSKQPPVVTQEVTTHGKKISALNVAPTAENHFTKKLGSKHTTNTSDLHITAKQKIIDTQTDSATPTETLSATFASTVITSNATAVMQKAHSTSGTLTMSRETTLSPRSSRPRSKGHPEWGTGKGLKTTPEQDIYTHSTQTPGMSYDDGTSETLSTEIGKTTVVPGTTASPQRKHSTVLIIAMVLFFLLILVLLVACLYCRRRRRSGSTSFNTAQWAGQAALPDDTGLEKDVEQVPLATGEKETRRATLTTFFGKRQSRVASIAMEEIDGKEREEAQKLIDGNAGGDSSPQGPGEANGKVSQSNQEKTPPTQVE